MTKKTHEEQADHEKQVNAFIPFAMRQAEEVVRELPKTINGKDEADEWNKAFFAAMNDLTAKAGLRVL